MHASSRNIPQQQAVRVLMVSTSYPRDAADWRGIFMRHLVNALSRQSNVQLALWAPPGELPLNVTSAASNADSEWLAWLMRAGGISHILRRSRVSGLVAAANLLRLLRSAYRRNHDVDLYHVNWLQCAIPLPRNQKPLLLSVLGNDLKMLELPFMRALLTRAMRNRRVVISPNADWMVATLKRSFPNAHVAPVSFGIDPMWFGIKREPVRPSLWLAITRLTKTKLGDLFTWSEQVFKGQPRELHLFGPMQEDIQVPAWVHYHGSATPEQLAADWFPKASGLITLSQHAEGRPQVMLEAMAAGLPIVSSAIPAHQSLVQHGITGSLCATPENYWKAVEETENPAITEQQGSAARDWVLNHIGTWDDCAARYTSLYTDLLAEAASRG